MRWLFIKDLQILRRSPVLLIVYPIAIAVLIGFALSRGPETPRVAFLNEIPAGTPLVINGQQLDVTSARGELCSRIDCIDVSSEEQARQMVQSGEVLAALILPKDFISDLESLASLNPSQPTVKVLVNEEDPVKASLVNDRIGTLINQANLKLSKKVTRLSATYLTLLLRGGHLSLLGQTLDILGLENTQKILESIQPELPKNSPSAADLARVINFARLARQNLNLATPLLSSIAHPINVDKEVVSGSPPSLDAFAISLAATVTLMFVTVLLVAGSLALEREENAFARLTRGLVSKWALLGEKVTLGVVLSILVTLVMLGGLSLFVHIEWSRFGLILLAIAAGGLAADRLHLPRRVRHREPGALRRDQGRAGPVPVRRRPGCHVRRARPERPGPRRADPAPGDPGRRIRGAGADRAAASRGGVRSAPNWLSVSAEEVTDGNS